MLVWSSYEFVVNFFSYQNAKFAKIIAAMLCVLCELCGDLILAVRQQHAKQIQSNCKIKRRHGGLLRSRYQEKYVSKQEIYPQKHDAFKPFKFPVRSYDVV